jgi:addiction module HigA family antidote
MEPFARCCVLKMFRDPMGVLKLSGHRSRIWTGLWRFDRGTGHEGIIAMSYRLENPGHPGGYVRRNIIEPRNLTVMDAAGLLDVPRQTLFDFLNEEIALSPELALRIETVFGVEMETLMEMQTQFDIADVRKRCQSLQSELAAKARSHLAASEAQDASAPPPTIIRRGHAFG